MTATTTMTIRISVEVKQDLQKLAQINRRTNSFLAGEAIAAYVAREIEIVEGIESGLADIAAGRVVPHDKAMEALFSAIEDVESDGQ